MMTLETMRCHPRIHPTQLARLPESEYCAAVEDLEALGDRDLKPEQLKDEIKRAKALKEVAATVIENGRLVLDAQKIMMQGGLLQSDELWEPLAPGLRDKREKLAQGRNERKALPAAERETPE